MKRIVSIFIIVLISIGLADLLTGILLTSIYIPSMYTTSSFEMSKYVQYMITAATITIALTYAFKVKNKLNNSKSAKLS
ncbi:hypothetical protein QUF56_11095 [Ureibacillus composti]|nr:hypothetical protein [Ureibacillus composti]